MILKFWEILEKKMLDIDYQECRKAYSDSEKAILEFEFFSYYFVTKSEEKYKDEIKNYIYELANKLNSFSKDTFNRYPTFHEKDLNKNRT
jgi:hypothetical protein